MTIEYCNFIAHKLVGLYTGGEYEPPEISDAWMSTGLFRIAYGKPKSKGGKYVTAEDMDKLFSIGISYGIQKVIGWKTHWDATRMTAIGGYPKGSVIRHNSGKKMISRRDYNRGEPPESYEDTTSWKTIRCATEFYFDRSTDHSAGVVLNSTTLPEEPTTKNIVVGPLLVNKGDTGGFVFLYKLRRFLKFGSLSEEKPINICSSGNFRMKLSVYNDIYTNSSHKDAYIEVLHQEEHLDQIETRYRWHIEALFRNPHKVIPWSVRLPCYVYLEYENGQRAYEGQGGWKFTEDLALAKIVRKLQPPTV